MTMVPKNDNRNALFSVSVILKCVHRKLAGFQFQATPSGIRFRRFSNFRRLLYFMQSHVIDGLLRFPIQQ